MPESFGVLAVTAASIGFLHTLMGPDHYVPFIVLARVRGWGIVRTALVTALCGVGHVLSSVALGLIGIAAGIAVFKLEGIEGGRGTLAAWLLLAFGLAYLAWGIHRAIRGRTHAHSHAHIDGKPHDHEHDHAVEHAHVHEAKTGDVTPWVLFIVFAFGPCEPLIPILMYPAAQGWSWMAAVAVAGIFAAVTIATMVTVVLASAFGLSFLPLKRAERYSHAAAGFAIAAAGGTMLLGL